MQFYTKFSEFANLINNVNLDMDFKKIKFNELEKIIFKSGNLLKKEKFIYREGIFAARAQKTVWNIIFGGLTLFLQLEGRNKEIKLRLSKANAQDILKILFGE